MLCTGTMRIIKSALTLAFVFKSKTDAFAFPGFLKPSFMVSPQEQGLKLVGTLGDLFGGRISIATFPASQACKARDIVQSLVEDEKCFSTEAGAIAFGKNCAEDVVYEDCFESEPFIGKTSVTNHMLSKVTQRKGLGDVRIDNISDGTSATGFAWTWTCGEEEGLRGTTFVELNDDDEIQYVREIPEPLYKLEDWTLLFLKAMTANAEPKPKQEYRKRTPTTANEIVKYLFLDVQGSEIDESMRFFKDSIIYRDFNYNQPLQGLKEVRKFIEDFSFPGIEFRPERFDDGVNATCFTWEVVLDGQTDTVKGISFYELDPETKSVIYVRDVPESAIKPPPLGKIARTLRPGLGVFKGVPFGSRPGGK